MEEDEDEHIAHGFLIGFYVAWKDEDEQTTHGSLLAFCCFKL